MPPLRARRSTSSISGSEPFLGTNADAPACVARSTHCGSRCAVTTTITSSGRTSRSRRVAASPSWRGISMSMTTMSGLSSAAIATASAALPAVPTHSRSGSEDSASESRSANVWWSSTTMTRSGTAAVSSCVVVMTFTISRLVVAELAPAIRGVTPRDLGIAKILRATEGERADRTVARTPAVMVSQRPAPASPCRQL